MSNVALKLPPLSIGGTSVASKLGDQALPRTFSSSPWAGDFVKWPIRGLSFDDRFGTREFSRGPNGRRSAADSTGRCAGRGRTVDGGRVEPAVSVTPRGLVPMDSKTQASVGTAIRSEVSQHVSLVSDVGAAGTTQHGWDPLASAAIIGHWSGAEFETNLLRGASPVGTTDIPTVRSLDREIIRGQVRSIPGITISTQASRSRPTGAPASADTTVGSIGVAYDHCRSGYQRGTTGCGQLGAAGRHTRIEWRRKPVGGIVVRYIQSEQTPRDRLLPGVSSKQMELEVPGWIARDLRNRLDVGAVLTEKPGPGEPTVSSTLSGRFDVVGDVGITGDTAVGFTSGGPTLRGLRLASRVPLVDRTAVQLIYTYQAAGPMCSRTNRSRHVSRAPSRS